MALLENIAAIPKMEDIIPLIEETLAAGKSIRVWPMGTSMLPMLRQGIDSVVLSSPSQKLEKYDLPLYRRENGKYLLHRVVHVGEDYSCRGDNTYKLETGLQHSQIIAIVTAFYRGEKKYSVKDPIYLLYCKVWCYSYPIRRFLRRGVRWMKRRFSLTIKRH